jgi:hypothetical protein
MMRNDDVAPLGNGLINNRLRTVQAQQSPMNLPIHIANNQTRIVVRLLQTARRNSLKARNDFVYSQHDDSNFIEFPQLCTTA